MKRIDRVLEYVRRVCRHTSDGVSAEEVATGLGIARANASADLNALWRQGLLEKRGGRPVRYAPVGSPQQAGARPDPGGATAPRTSPVSSGDGGDDDPFRTLVGWKESLSAAVKQAKAAVLYPGGGLHTLICGPTGVGKSVLAELMFQFGVQSGAFRPGARLVIFNCADYASNPQLLMAQLFGVVRGAYTGADRDQAGLVEQADGGMLFLDEVHRLPPEGQEMLFRLIDKGLFRRLGETGVERTSRPLIVCATTERADSALLRTFIRRIPMVINLPPLAERTLGERFRLLRRFFRAEARKMGAPLVVLPQTLEYLLLYDCPGNVGQLKSDVQLACAQAFLRYLSDGRVPIAIGPDVLPDHVRRQVGGVRERRGELEEIMASCPSGLVVELGEEAPAEEQGTELFNLYETMERETRALAGTVASPEELQRHLAAKVEAHFRQFLNSVHRQYEAGRQELTAVVDVSVLAAVEHAVAYAEGHLRRRLPNRILFGLALHVQAALERLRLGTRVPYPLMDSVRSKHPREYEAAVTMVRMISEQLHVTLPEGEAAYTALFLAAGEAEGDGRRVALAVACHGQGVASGMAEVAEHLAGRVGVLSLDMPLDGSPEDVVQRLSAWLKQGEYAGLLLFVDMGSLSFLADRLEHATSVPVRVVPMASTILLIEAIQQVQLPGATLNQVYESVVEAQRRMTALPWAESSRAPVILTCCFTGQGNAELLKKVVQRALWSRGITVEVVAASIPSSGDWERLFHTLLRGRPPAAVVGPVNPGLPGVPFFSSAEVLTREGQARLAALLDRQSGGIVPERLADRDLPADELARTLAAGVEADFEHTNPYTLLPEAVRAADALAQVAGVNLPADVRIGLIMHIACLAEHRAAQRQPDAAANGEPELDPVARCFAPLAQRFGVHFTPDDLSRIQQILQTWRNTSDSVETS